MSVSTTTGARRPLGAWPLPPVPDVVLPHPADPAEGEQRGEPLPARSSVLPDLRRVSLASKVRPTGAAVAGAVLAGLAALAALTTHVLTGAATGPAIGPGTSAAMAAATSLPERLLAAVVLAAASALCWLRGARATQAERPAWGWLALGLTLAVASVPGARVQPELGAALLLGFAPCCWLALLSLAQAATTTEPVSTSRRLDGAAVGLGAAALVAAALAPALTAHGDKLQAVLRLLAVVYTLVLAGLATGLATVRGWRLTGTSWLLLGACMLVLGSEVLRLDGAAGSDPMGSGLAPHVAVLAWPLAAVALALVAGRPAGAAAAGSGTTTAEVVAPVLVAVAMLGLLLSGVMLPPLTIVLAVASVLAVPLRLVTTLREVRELFVHREQARTDDLTGLANRRAFVERAEPLLARSWEEPLALLLLDLDRFKEVNDSLGHDAGDRLLVVAADRLRAASPPGSVLARLGGDEFALLLPDSDVTRAVRVADAFAHTLGTVVPLDGLALRTRASTGIALAPAHGRDVSELLRCADIAMYDAKSSAASHRVYNPRSDHHGEERLRLIDQLREGIVAGELVLRFQPKLDVAEGVVHSVEALVRWEHPERGLLGPGEFLPLAETAGLMPALTDAVLAQAVAQAATWQRTGTPLAVAVNLTTAVLLDVDLPERLATLLRDAGVPTSLLHVEVTEELLMTDRERTTNTLSRLRGRGIRVAIDDFGTGYSSLSYLRELPVDDLKLDLSFVLPMDVDPRAAALVASTTELAHSLGLRLVAEGVETATILEMLRACGCDEAQGWYVGKPLPPTELLAHLRERGLLASRSLLASAPPVPA